MLRFDQSVTAPPDGIVVFGTDGRRVSGAVTQTAGGTVVRTPVLASSAPSLPVRWRELSPDGHVGTGVFTFGSASSPRPRPRRSARRA